MAYLNEVDQATADAWVQNFENLSGNIFQIFQDETLISKTIYDAVSNSNNFNLSLYLGLDDNGNRKMIALGAYYLQPGDSSETGYCDVVEEGKVYEVYSNSVVTVEKAREYINNWKNLHLTNPIFKLGFLVPRPNTMKLFVEDGNSHVRFFFGFDGSGDLKMMMQKPNPGTGDVISDYITPCPPICRKFSLI